MCFVAVGYKKNLCLILLVFLTKQYFGQHDRHEARRAWLQAAIYYIGTFNAPACVSSPPQS